jgi:hypothetical protein
MTNLDELITKYVAIWNEPDADVRQKSIPAVWSEQAGLFNRVNEYHGHAGVERAVQRSYDLFVVRGFRFRPRTQPAAHHNAIRFTWEMITPEGEVSSIGTQFLVLDEHHRISLDYQFIETAPAS